VSPNKEGGGKL